MITLRSAIGGALEWTIIDNVVMVLFFMISKALVWSTLVVRSCKLESEFSVNKKTDYPI